MRYCRACESSTATEDNGLCEACDEVRKERFAEKYLERLEVVCVHCGGVFSPAAYDAHRFRVYYRTHEFPKGRQRTRR